MRSCRLPFFIAACAFGLAWSGNPSRADSLRSPACLGALDALHSREATLASTRVLDPGLLALRRRAAAVCLGVRDDARVVPGRLAQPPVSTSDLPRAPAVVALPSPTPTLSQPRSLAVPTAPLTTLNCDAVGCTASDGSRLNRMGPNLWGPGGACIALGPVLQCP